MNYQIMTSKQLSQALTQAKVKGRSKATSKAQKIELLIDWEEDLRISKSIKRSSNSTWVRKMAEHYNSIHAA